MAIEQFDNGELLASVRSKLNANDVELNQRVTVLETSVAGFSWASIKPSGGVLESDLATAVQAKLNATHALQGANTDITSLGGLTGGVYEVDFVRFDLTPETVPTTPGTLYWDGTDNAQTLSLTLAGGTSVLQVGQEQHYRIKAASSIGNGKVVMIVGAQGNSGTLLATEAAGVITSKPEVIIGVATENIAANAFGYVTSFGVVRGINTTGSLVGETWLDGDTLYYNPAVVGGMTKVRPTAPNAMAILGNVIHAANNGSIHVRVHHGSTLGGSDGNVQFGTLANNDFIAYNSTAQRWENKTAGASRTALGLGELATQNKNAVVVAPQISATPVSNGEMVFQLTSNTSLAIKVKGSDGVVRQATLTLA